MRAHLALQTGLAVLNLGGSRIHALIPCIGALLLLRKRSCAGAFHDGALYTKEGATLDFYLADRRNAKAAKRFLAKALRRSRDWIPRVINTDKNPAYGEAIAELKKEGRLPKDTQHRQVKYLNNRLEGDHGKLKRLIRPTLGFQSMKTAYTTIKGFEVMRMFKKGQFTAWIDAIGGGTEARSINRLFGLYA